MATLSLFRKWRSQSFDDLVGQEAVVRTLRNALTSGSPARAYLFCGPRGTGKTSTARIFAKALNCSRGPTPEPCNECSLCRRIADGSCMDVLEIDAASHTQVDKIRDFIVDKVHFAPAEARFKVYIIDEVHKLSTSSFNALLKTLEEPPPHVVFILATTHPHELLPTILSRCQRHDFHRLTPPEIRDRLALVAREEGIDLAPGAAELLARSAEGSLRDALVQLEQVATFAGEAVAEEDVRTLLGLAGREAMNRLVGALASADARSALQTLHDLIQAGRDPGRLSGELVEHLRRLLLVVVKAGDGELLGVPPEELEDLRAQASQLSASRVMGWLKAAMELQGEARDAQRSRLLWEMMLIRLAVPEVEVDLEALARRVERLEAALQGGAPAAMPPPARVQAPPPQPAPAPPPRPPAAQAPPTRPTAAPAPPPRPPAPSAPSAPTAPPARVEPRPAPAPPAPPARPADLGWGDVASPARGAGASRPAPARPPVAPLAPERAPVPDRASAADRAPAPDRPPAPPRPAAPVQPPPSAAVPASPGVPPGALPSARDFWQGFLTRVKERNGKMHAVLVEARVQRFEEGELALVFPGDFRWHFERFQEGRGAVETLAQEFLGRPVRVSASLGGDLAAAPAAEEEHRDFVKRAGSVFNGRVVDEPRG